MLQTIEHGYTAPFESTIGETLDMVYPLMTTIAPFCSAVPDHPYRGLDHPSNEDPGTPSRSCRLPDIPGFLPSQNARPSKPPTRRFSKPMPATNALASAGRGANEGNYLLLDSKLVAIDAESSAGILPDVQYVHSMYSTYIYTTDVEISVQILAP